MAHIQYKEGAMDIVTWVKFNLGLPEERPEPTPQELLDLADAVLNADQA